MVPRHRVLLGLLCASSLSIASGCCTMTLLGSLDSVPVNQTTSEDGSAQDQTDAVAWMVALVPLAVAVDVLTLPLQLLFVSGAGSRR